jgi:hypothetical protein
LYSLDARIFNTYIILLGVDTPENGSDEDKNARGNRDPLQNGI